MVIICFDAFRFTYFSRASLDYIVKCGKQPDVIHIHNWETAIIGPLFWDIFAKQVQLITFLQDIHIHTGTVLLRKLWDKMLSGFLHMGLLICFNTSFT